MKLHPHVINKILYLCTNYGGHKDERKLVAELNNLRLSPYMGDRVNLSLVDTHAFVQERLTRNMPTNDIVPMRLHSSAIQKIMYAYDMYSGHVNETKLRASIIDLDFTPYERKEQQETILVLTSDYMQTLQQNGNG